MTGVFGTPIAAVLLAVELLLFEWKPRSFMPVAAAVLVAAGVRPFLLGHGPLFPMAAHPRPRLDRAVCWPLGVGHRRGPAVGPADHAALRRARTLFERLTLHWMWWPALGGLVVGLGGLIDPSALGVGYDVIGDLLRRPHAAGRGGTAAAGQGGDLDHRPVVGHLRRRAGAAADPGRRAGRDRGPLAAGRRGLLGADRHGGDDGRHHARAADRRAVRLRTDRRLHRPAGRCWRPRRGLCGDRAAAEALDPDREDRPARPAPHPRIQRGPVPHHARARGDGLAGRHPARGHDGGAKPSPSSPARPRATRATRSSTRPAGCSAWRRVRRSCAG